MWTNWHICKGQGFIFYKNNKYICKCFIPGYTINGFFKGKIWVNDNYKPITPPSSPC